MSTAAKPNSITAFIKIRYEDFSTTTVQETQDHNINTLDSYFQIIKGLFEKKYIQGRGIRLLGVGFENVTKEEKPYQQDLFANNDFEIMYFDKRIAYFKSYEEQKPSLNPPFSSVYVCKDMLPKQIVFEKVNK